jgi:hypothetical protein
MLYAAKIPEDKWPEPDKTRIAGKFSTEHPPSANRPKRKISTTSLHRNSKLKRKFSAKFLCIKIQRNLTELV